MASKLKTVVSASRRTDLPSFYYDWMQHVLKRGEAELPNPIFKHKTYKVDLRPENTHSIVLWSKNFSNVWNDPGYLANYNLYFQYTINDYSQFIEPNVPDYKTTLHTLEGLLKIYRPEQFNIRFDPVLISEQAEPEPVAGKPGRARLAAFERLCYDLAVLGMKGCRISSSYIALYSHVQKRLQRIGIKTDVWPDDIILLFFQRMADIAANYGFALYSCASPLLQQVKGIEKGHCIDGSLLEKLFGGKVSKARDNSQRLACGCTKSSDIGSYEQVCRHGCVYCYSVKG